MKCVVLSLFRATVKMTPKPFSPVESQGAVPVHVQAEDGLCVIFPVLSPDRKQQEHAPVLWVPAATRRRNEENAASQIRPPVRTRSIPADSRGVITACVVPPQTLMTVNRSRERVIVQTAQICLARLSPVAPGA